MPGILTYREQRMHQDLKAYVSLKRFRIKSPENYPSRDVYSYPLPQCHISVTVTPDGVTVEILSIKSGGGWMTHRQDIRCL